MNIAVFGATGGTGKQVVRQALGAGHRVTAFVRNPEKLGFEHPDLALCHGDVTDPEKVEQAIAGQDAVISVLGPSRPPVPGMMETAAKNITTAMQKYGVNRLISTTGAGVRDPEDQPKLFDIAMKALMTVITKDVLQDSEANVKFIRATDLDWTIVRFPRLVEGQRTGKYRIGNVGKESGSQLSRADAADFIIRELEQGEYIHKAPVISY